MENKTINKKTSPDYSVSYNKFKRFGGKFYTGARVGMGQRWYYDKGERKERKVTPERWEFTYSVKKRRAGNAPEGSGAPVGTECHWYIIAHQIVRKLNANDYDTSMSGIKYKVAHKRTDKDNWSASVIVRHKRLLNILEEVITDLKKTPPEEGGEIMGSIHGKIIEDRKSEGKLKKPKN